MGAVSSWIGGTGYTSPLNYSQPNTNALQGAITGITVNSPGSLTVAYNITQTRGSSGVQVGDTVSFSGFTAPGGMFALNGQSGTVTSIASAGGTLLATVAVTFDASTYPPWTAGGYVQNTNPLLGGIAINGDVGFYPSALTAVNPTGRTDFIVAANPDLVIIAAGINDATQQEFSNGLSWPFESGVTAVLQRLRSRLPNAVLVVCAPWTGVDRGPSGTSDAPNAEKDLSIQAQLAAIAGPWVFIDTQSNMWQLKRADGSTTSGTTGAVIGPNAYTAWARGAAYTANSLNDQTAPDLQPGNDAFSNAGDIIGDGTHPAGFAQDTLAVPVVASASVPFTLTLGGNMAAGLPYSGTVSVQAAGGPQLNYANEVQVTYTSKSIADHTLIGCLVTPSNSGLSLPRGSNVYSRFLNIPEGTYKNGVDYYAQRIATALLAAAAAF
jgi:hypothetical protein